MTLDLPQCVKTLDPMRDSDIVCAAYYLVGVYSEFKRGDYAPDLLYRTLDHLEAMIGARLGKTEGGVTP